MLKNKTKINESLNILDIINCRLYLYIKIGIARLWQLRIKSKGGTSGIRMEKKANENSFTV